MQAIQSRVQSQCAAYIDSAYVFLSDEFDYTSKEFMANNKTAAVVCWPQSSSAQWDNGCGNACLALKAEITIKVFVRNALDNMPRMDYAITGSSGFDVAAASVLTALSQYCPEDGSGNCYLLEPMFSQGYSKASKTEVDGFHQINARVSVLYRHPA